AKRHLELLTDKARRTTLELLHKIRGRNTGAHRCQHVNVIRHTANVKEWAVQLLRFIMKPPIDRRLQRRRDQRLPPSSGPDNMVKTSPISHRASPPISIVCMDQPGMNPTADTERSPQRPKTPFPAPEGASQCQKPNS